MRKNRVWIAVVVCFVLSFANLLFAENTASSTGNTDAIVDVLKTLQQKGVITQAEYDALKAKVNSDAQKAAEQQQVAVQQAVEQAAPQLKTVAMADEAGEAASVVSAMDNAVGFHTGRFDITFSGEVNGFALHSRPETAHPVAADLGLIDQSPDSTWSVRSGLLPSDLNIKVSTQERGWDVAVYFGIWPAIQSSNLVGVENGLAAAIGSGTVAAGTSGIDFRQNFATLGHAHFGTLKIGRDLGLFGQEAILNDMTLLGAGSTNGNNITPNNVTFGRIGVGYIYTDFIPQVTYTTPSYKGFQGAFSFMQAFDDPLWTLYTGIPLSGHTQPQLQGKLTYTYPGHGPVKFKVWSNFVTQKQTAQFGAGALAPGDGVRATGVDYGFNVGWHGLTFVGYGYNGWGIGLAGLLYDGIGFNNSDTAPIARPSQGWYSQLGYNWHKNFFGFSYGQSNLSPASNFDQAAMQGVVLPAYLGGGGIIRNNTALIGQYRYAVTKWDNLVGEYTHATSENQNFAKGDSDSFAFGTIVFF